MGGLPKPPVRPVGDTDEGGASIFPAEPSLGWASRRRFWSCTAVTGVWLEAGMGSDPQAPSTEDGPRWEPAKGRITCLPLGQWS